MSALKKMATSGPFTMKVAGWNFRNVPLINKIQSICMLKTKATLKFLIQLVCMSKLFHHEMLKTALLSATLATFHIKMTLQLFKMNLLWVMQL